MRIMNIQQSLKVPMRYAAQIYFHLQRRTKTKVNVSSCDGCNQQIICIFSFEKNSVTNRRRLHPFYWLWDRPAFMKKEFLRKKLKSFPFLFSSSAFAPKSRKCRMLLESKISTSYHLGLRHTAKSAYRLRSVGYNTLPFGET